ncbi:partner and localizer of BRCA2 isoform X1 [Carcharodon carcharias]|uniref:partner and localizer of BRCA2 isoform X1 n=2 Tax=Carcharodon carcharias TaxID=13397 RepID=UPI001B7EBE23|nr:partner and localizer of BRCA2 isoform X1 [Carcharodon carcharias]
MENSVKKPLSWETRQQLKERLALLKKEYAKTVYKLQRAQKADRVRNHVKNTITHQNQLLEEQSATQLTTGESSPFLDTRQSSSSYQRSQVPLEESNEKKSAVTFNLELEIIDAIGGPNVALTSTCENVEDPSAEPAFSPVVEIDPVAKTDSRVPSRLKLKKKRLSEVLKKEVCGAASELNASLAVYGEPCVKGIEELDSAVTEKNARSSIFNRSNYVPKSLGRDVKENVQHNVFYGSSQGEDDSVSLKNEAQEVAGNCLTSPLGRTVNDTVCCSPGDKSTAVSVCENEAFSSRDPEALTKATRPQQAKPNCSEDLIEASESNLTSEAAVLELGRLQTSTAVHEAPEDSPLNSCTLVEGLLFPVEYYVRTTRRMTSSQRQVDLDAVIHSHLGKCRNSGRGRSRKSTHDQSSPVKALPKAEGEINDTLLLFNSQEGDFAASNATSSQHDSLYPWNFGVDSQSIKSSQVKGRKRDKRGSIKPKLTDTKVFKDAELAERTLNNHTIPDVQRIVTSDVQSERESKENESNFCQPVPNTNERYENAVNKLNSHDFSGITNFNIKSFDLSQDKPKHIVEPLQSSIESQTNDVFVWPFKEDSNDLPTTQRESVSTVLEHHSGLNSDTDSQEMVPETQQGPFLGKSFSGTRQLFPLGIDLNKEDTLSQESQPRRRVRLSKGNCYRRTRAGSRKLTSTLEEGTLTCSEPLLPVKKPVVKRLFHSLEVQDFDLPDEEYGQLKEKLRAGSLRKSLLPSQHNMVDCTVETQVETENWDTGHSPNIKQTAENLEEHHPQKSLDCKEMSRTPEEPAADDMCPYGQKRPITTSGCQLSSSVLLSTPSCTPKARNVHQCEQGAGSPVFPSLGFTPASSSPVLSQNSHGKQNSSQIATLSHACEDAQNNDGNCGQRSQISTEGMVPLVNNEDTLSAREHLDKDESAQEHFHGNCETNFCQSEVLNEDYDVKFAEEDTVIEEDHDALTLTLPSKQLEQKLKRQTLQLISMIQNPSTSCIIDLCTVFWIVKEAKTSCIACACETAVFLWAPQQLNQWTNIHTWTFNKVYLAYPDSFPEIGRKLNSTFLQPDLQGCYALVLHSTERGCLEHTLLQAGDINAVLGLPGRRLVCSCGTLQSQHIELSTLSKEGRSKQCMQLVPPNEMVLAFSEVEGEAEALLGSTIMSNIVIWNLKTGHLLKKIHLSESYPGTVCQKAYSESGILFLLLSHRYVGTCDGAVRRRVCVLRMIAVNPMNGKSRPVMSYMLPLECNGRYIVGGVKNQSIAAVVTPGILVLWDIPSGHISTMLQHSPNGHWSLFHWAEANSCLLVRKNDRTVYIYKCVGAKTVAV